jgi:nucleoside-diphosphate-sugar epimerase
MVASRRNGTKRPEKSPGRDSRGRVVVIGGAGYVGSVLVRQLLDRGYEVTLIDALLYGDSGIGELYGRDDVEVIQADLRDVDVIRHGALGSDAVVHLGGLVGDPACALDERLTLEVNLGSTRAIGRAVAEVGVRRFVFASTCAVYGARLGLRFETSIPSPVSLYARTKVESERVLLDMVGHGFTPVVLRFGTFYGLSPRPRFDLVVNLLTAKAVTEGSITIFDGDQWRPFVHVVDGSRAIIRSLEAPEQLVGGQVYNVGSEDQNLTLVQIAEVIRAEVPGVVIGFEETSESEASYRVSFRKVRQELGFSPVKTVAAGVREVAAAVYGGHISDYRAAKYSNVQSLVGARARLPIRKATDAPRAATVPAIADPVASTGKGGRST